MAITEEQVKQAEQAADEAADRADAAQDTADASRETARRSREAAEQARREEGAADVLADTKESEAAQRRGEADAASRACQRSQEAASRAQQQLDQAEANARAVQAQHPGECNADTVAADSAVAAAQSEVQRANASSGPVCEDAAEKQQAAEQARIDAENARTAANRADERADLANDQAEDAEETARADQAAAARAVVDAANARTTATQLREEFEAQAPPTAPGPGPVQAPPPDQPNHGDSAGHAGQPPPPTHGPGTGGSSLFDLNFTALNQIWKFSAGKWDKAPIFLEITEGSKHKYNLGSQYTLVAGTRAEEIGGVNTRVTLAGDWRQINTLRMERNAGIKAESVLGEVDETVYAKEVRNTPAIRRDKNPSKVKSKGPHLESIATKAINDFKSSAYDKYTTVRVQANRAKYHCDAAYITANVWNSMISKMQENMDEHNAKFTELEEQCKNFKAKSSGFVKMIASGAIKLKTGKLTGKIESKVKVIASSLAEFKGNVKLGG